MYAHSHHVFEELERLGLPGDLGAKGDIQAGMPLADEPYLQLHEPLDAARAAELSRLARVAQLSLSEGSTVSLDALAAMPSLRGLAIVQGEGSYDGVDALTGLQALQLRGAVELRREVLAPIVRARRLELLQVDRGVAGAGVADALASLAEAPSLRALVLRVDRGAVSASDLGELCAAPGLRTLDLGNNAGWLRDDHLGSLAAASALETLILRDNGPHHASITDAGLVKHAGGLRALRHLDLTTCKGVGWKGLQAVAKLPLRRVAVGSTYSSDRKTNDKAVAMLAALSELEHLHLQGCASLTDAGFGALGHLTALGALVLVGQHKVSLGAVERYLASLSKLRVLALEAPVTDETLASLPHPEQLVRVWLSDVSRLTERGYRALASMSAPERVELWGCSGEPAMLELLAKSPLAGKTKLFCPLLGADERAALGATYPQLRIY